MRRWYLAYKQKETPEQRATRPAKCKEYRARTRQHHVDYNKRWYLEHREYKLKQTGIYQRTHRDQEHKTRAAWRKKNPDKMRKYAADSRARHLEERRKRGRDRYRQNKKEFNRKSVARRRLWPEFKKEIQRAKMRDYYRKNKLKFYAYVHKRRALKKAVEVKPEKIFEWMQEIKSKPFAFCYYCQKRVSTAVIQFDHVLALTRGGPHSITNLAVSCRDCNAQKYNTLIQDWEKSGQQVLPL